MTKEFSLSPLSWKTPSDSDNLAEIVSSFRNYYVHIPVPTVRTTRSQANKDLITKMVDNLVLLLGPQNSAYLESPQKVLKGLPAAAWSDIISFTLFTDHLLGTNNLDAFVLPHQEARDIFLSPRQRAMLRQNIILSFNEGDCLPALYNSLLARFVRTQQTLDPFKDILRQGVSIFKGYEEPSHIALNQALINEARNLGLTTNEDFTAVFEYLHKTADRALQKDKHGQNLIVQSFLLWPELTLADRLQAAQEFVDVLRKHYGLPRIEVSAERIKWKRPETTVAYFQGGHTEVSGKVIPDRSVFYAPWLIDADAIPAFAKAAHEILHAITAHPQSLIDAKVPADDLDKKERLLSLLEKNRRVYISPELDQKLYQDQISEVYARWYEARAAKILHNMILEGMERDENRNYLIDRVQELLTITVAMAETAEIQEDFDLIPLKRALKDKGSMHIGHTSGLGFPFKRVLAACAESPALPVLAARQIGRYAAHVLENYSYCEHIVGIAHGDPKKLDTMIDATAEIKSIPTASFARGMLLPSLKAAMDERGFQNVRTIYDAHRERHPEIEIDYSRMALLAVGIYWVNHDDQPTAEALAFSEILGANVHSLFAEHQQIGEVGKEFPAYWRSFDYLPPSNAYPPYHYPSPFKNYRRRTIHSGNRYDPNDAQLMLPEFAEALFKNNFRTLTELVHVIELEENEKFNARLAVELTRGACPVVYNPRRDGQVVSREAQLMSKYLGMDLADLFSERQYFTRIEGLRKLSIYYPVAFGLFTRGRDVHSEENQFQVIASGHGPSSFFKGTNYNPAEQFKREAVLIVFGPPESYRQAEAPRHPPRWAQTSLG